MQSRDGAIYRLIGRAEMPDLNPWKHPTPPEVKRAKKMRRRADGRCKATKVYRKWRATKQEEALQREEDRRANLQAQIHQDEITSATAIRFDDTVELNVVQRNPIDGVWDGERFIPLGSDVSVGEIGRPISLPKATPEELREVHSLNFSYLPDGEYGETDETPLPRPDEYGLFDYRSPFSEDAWKNIHRG